MDRSTSHIGGFLPAASILLNDALTAGVEYSMVAIATDETAG